MSTSSCHCIHGTCLDEVEGICECSFGFEGVNCEVTAILFSTGPKKSHEHPEVIAAIVVSCVMLILLLIAGYVIHKKCKRIRREQKRFRAFQIEEKVARDFHAGPPDYSDLTTSSYNDSKDTKGKDIITIA